MNWMQIVNAILNQEAANRYGLRADGTPKGIGYYGELPGIGENKGYIMTENSIGVNLNGRQQEIPTIIPTLNNEELRVVLSGGMNDGIVDKSIKHAVQRMSKGLSPFASPKDLVIPSPKIKRGK
jgi:hypothetical protein